MTIQGCMVDGYFRSAVSSSFYVSLSITIVGFLLLVTAGALVGSGAITLLGSLISLPVVLIHVWLYHGTEYVITSYELIIKSPGSSDEHIPKSDIVCMRKVKNIVSARALSSERIEITKKDGSRDYISPVNRDYFLDVFYDRAANN